MFNCPKTSFNNWPRTAAGYTKVNNVAKIHAKPGKCHVLVAITEDKYG